MFYVNYMVSLILREQMVINYVIFTKNLTLVMMVKCPVLVASSCNELLLTELLTYWKRHLFSILRRFLYFATLGF